MRKNTVFKNDQGRQKILTMYDAALLGCGVGIKQRVCKTSFGDTYMVEAGEENEDILVLLHGASSNSTSWISDFHVYAQKYKVIAVDIIGEPGKSAETRLSYETMDYALWLHEVFDAMQIKKAHIVGLSQGGWLAVCFAGCFPERVNKMVLLSPAGIVRTAGSFIFKAIFYSLFGKAGRKKINEIILGEQSVDPKVIEFMDLMQDHVNARMDKEYIFQDEELENLTMPVLFIGGRRDVIRSTEQISKRLGGILPDLKTIIDENKGHVLVDTSEEIVNFLQN